MDPLKTCLRIHVVRTVLAATFLLLLPDVTVAQELERGLERDLEQYIQESGVSAEAEDLDELMRHPRDLASFTIPGLLAFPGMSSAVAQRIWNGLRRGSWTSVRALCDSLHLSDPLRRYLLLGTTIGSTVGSTIGTTIGTVRVRTDEDTVWRVTARSRMVRMLETTRGERENRMLGSPYDLTHRLRVQGPHVDVGVLCSKDAHEASLVDLVSGFARFRPIDGLHCIVGDYLVDEGLGSLTSRSVRQTKGSATTAVCMRVGGGLLPSTSTLPLRMYRGAAAQFDHSTETMFLRAWAGISRFSRAARIDSASGVMSSLDLSDLHRTAEERDAYGRTTERSLLGGCDIRWRSLRVSMTCLHRGYDLPVAIDISGMPRVPHGPFASAFAEYRLFEVRDLPYGATSPISRWMHASVNAEVVRDSLGRHGFVSTLILESTRSTIVMRARSAHPSLDLPMGSALSETGTLRNEEGVYVGLQSRTDDGTLLRCFVDVFRSLVPRSTLPVPMSGLELFGELTSDLAAASKLLLRCTHRVRTESERSADDVARSYRESLSTGRVVLDQRCTGTLSLSLRADLVTRSAPPSGRSAYGSAIGMEADWRLTPFLRMRVRSTIHSTDGYAAAIPVAEVAAPGSMRLVMLYDDGVRTTCSLEAAPMNGVRVWVRVEMTEKNSTASMGSSLTETQGPRQRTVFLQTEVRL